MGSSVHRLELDLDVFAGPFDLLLSLILREELDLMEVDVADIVVAYLDHLDERSELDLEAATEFLVLIAALLELKSRLMLPGEELPELDELAPAEAAEELLERMLQYARFRGAGGWMAGRHDDAQGFLFRSAPLPEALRRVPVEAASAAYSPDVLGEALGGLLRTPPPIDVSHMSTQRVSVAERLGVLRALLRRGAFSFDEAVRGADRATVAVTLFALLELYKRGEAAWEQAEPFGEITVRAGQHAAGAAEARVLEHPLEQLLGGLGGPQPVELVEHLLARQHQPRLELQQRRDQHQELGRGLEVERVLGLEVVQVGDDDLREVHLEQVELLAQDQREQQVEGACEDVEVQLELGEAHAPKTRRACGRARRPSPRARRPGRPR